MLHQNNPIIVVLLATPNSSGLVRYLGLFCPLDDDDRVSSANQTITSKMTKKLHRAADCSAVSQRDQQYDQPFSITGRFLFQCLVNITDTV